MIEFVCVALEQGDVFTPKRTRPKFSFGRVCTASNLLEEIITRLAARSRTNRTGTMKPSFVNLGIVAAVLAAGATPPAQASANSHGRACIARVLHSEELPFAPYQYWLVKVNLEITPPDGRAYEVSLHDNLPWQAPPPRRGQVFRVFCDPDNPADLRFIH
jgi:hypothetical protein